MSLKFYIILATFGISLALCRNIQFYRKDYTYLNEYDAYFKLHIDDNGVFWDTAYLACEEEGAQLFYPQVPEDRNIVRQLLEAQGLSLEDYKDVIVGIQNEKTEEFITIDGHSSPYSLINDKELDTSNHLCTTMDINDGSLYINTCSGENQVVKSYVCKKVEDTLCPTIDQGYKYVKETKKCYKVNNIMQSWHDALKTCLMEGGLLVNIESEMESKLVSRMINTEPFYHAGFRLVPPSRDYHTMKGVNLRYAFWNFYTDNIDVGHLCGTLRGNGDRLTLDTVSCNEKQAFICEIEV